ncbi:MAG: 16S rRNA (cytosine(967)-C(5))-methyltransferase [Symploca sp. SIO1B1]|nr:16S rRNA (cytosine(967)-C(5))-methyltransferase [Symploca sp. SIO1C2]NER99185.1 16S rRNA (cytosine(967)-C(5))-methyltransferase [Symploca sp. SIO1B1]
MTNNKQQTTNNKQPTTNPRQLAFLALREIYRRGTFTDVALNQVLKTAQLSGVDRRLVTELVYGVVRQRRTLDALIDQLGKKKAHQQPPDLRIILHLGLYQLRISERIPASAAVNTTVELAKANKFKGLTGVVNGLLRQYTRLAAKTTDPLQLPTEPIQRLGILYSFPDWIIEMWLEQLGEAATEELCQWFNQAPSIDIRVNTLQVSLEEVETAMYSFGIEVYRLPQLPQALRVRGSIGTIQQLPGFKEGWWTIQDSSAQLVSYLVNPQAGDMVIDACAAPGGKTTHLAELMADQGKIWACDRAASRLKKLQENVQRLQLRSIEVCTGDSRSFPQFTATADAVLVDAPCSGNGTLHRRPDIRWRSTPETVKELAQLQGELLVQAATWVKPDGVLVYATCTLHPQENERVIESFLENHPHWQIEPPSPNSLTAAFSSPQGWIKVWPHQHQMDGFFMVRLKRML